MTFDCHKIFFPSHMDKKVIEYLKQNVPDTSKTNVSNDLKMHHNTTTKYLKILENHKIIKKLENSGKTIYVLEQG